VRSTLGQRLVDVASSDRHTVKPWLSSKLDFSPPVTELPLPGSVFLGGRVDYVDGRPVAALAYQQGQHVVNSYLWPSDGKDRAAAFSAERGFQIAHWTRNSMNHWVISDLGREEFAAVVRALETAP
jgi:anti-sigma factor RsiW